MWSFILSPLPLWLAAGFFGFAGVSCSAFHPSGSRVLEARAASRGECPPALVQNLNEMSQRLVLVGANRGNAVSGITYSVGGTAFPVTADGYHLTAAHCITNREAPFQFVFREGPEESIAVDFARLVWMSPTDDLALLHLQAGRSIRPFPLAEHRRSLPGDPVYALGLAEKYLRPGEWASYCCGKVVRAPARPWWPFGARRVTIDHTAPVWLGDSGGPLIDENLCVVGVHSTANWGRGASGGCLDRAALEAIIAMDRKATRNRPPMAVVRPLRGRDLEPPRQSTTGMVTR